MKRENLFLIVIISILFFTYSIFAQIQFSPHTIIGGELSAIGAYSVYAIDVDGDLDIDLLSASAWDDEISWYENDGNRNFTEHIITGNTIGAVSVFAIDLDGDTDIDVLSASFDDSKIAWYENLGIVGIDTKKEPGTPASVRLSQNYPNPFNPSTAIEFDIPKTSNVTLKIFNILGEEVATLVSDRLNAGNYTYEWNASKQASGVYLYRLSVGSLSTKSDHSVVGRG